MAASPGAANKSKILTGSLFFENVLTKRPREREIIPQEVARTTFAVYQKKSLKCVRTQTARSSHSEIFTQFRCQDCAIIAVYVCVCI